MADFRVTDRYRIIISNLIFCYFVLSFCILSLCKFNMLMRQFLCLPAIACLLFSPHRVGSQTTEQDNYTLAFATNATLQPEFIDGLFMDTHCKKTTIKNIVDVKKNSVTGVTEVGAAEKKFTVINNQV